MKRTITIEGNKENLAKLEAMLALFNLKLVETEAETDQAEPKKAKAKVEYELPYTVNGTKVKIGTASGDSVPTPVFNAVKHTLKKSGAKWKPDEKVWKFNKKAEVEAFEKAWEEGGKNK